MRLYFAPLSCSMATRIALYESSQHAEFIAVELATKRLPDGGDYLAINPKGQVPALWIDADTILTEGPAVLQYVADQAPDAGLAPAYGTIERARLQQWLNYIATELHKAVFYLLFNPASPDAAKAFAREIVATRYDFVSRHLADRDFLVGSHFTVADAYLVTSLNWAAPGGIDLSRWPVLEAYRTRMVERPAVARAFGEEMAMRADG